MDDKQPKIMKRNEYGKEFIIVDYDVPFDRDTSERISFYGRFEVKNYVDGIKEFIEKGKCEIKGMGGEDLCLSRNGGINISMHSGNSSVVTSVNLEDLILDELNYFDKRDIVCGYCEKPIQGNYFTSRNNHRYCNEKCFSLYTED